MAIISVNEARKYCGFTPWKKCNVCQKDWWSLAGTIPVDLGDASVDVSDFPGETYYIFVWSGKLFLHLSCLVKFERDLEQAKSILA